MANDSNFLSQDPDADKSQFSVSYNIPLVTEATRDIEEERRYLLVITLLQART